MIFNYLFKYFHCVIDVIKSSCFGLYLLFYEPIALWCVMIGLPIVTELQAQVVLERYNHLGMFPSQYQEYYRKEYVKLAIALENWYGGKFL